MSYVACELHCHTVHSDGSFLVSELQNSAKKNGLSLMALTDHNTISGHDELDDNIIPAIRGIEWTTYFGHMLVLGTKDFVDWRDAKPDNIDEKILEVRNQNGIVGIAHPFQLGSPMCTGGRWEFNVNKWENVSYMEIWHEGFSKDNYENDKATALWYSLLDRGYHIAASYGRDWHRKEKKNIYGCTYIGIDGEINATNALKAIKEGRTIVSTGPAFSFEVKKDSKTYRLGETVPEGMAAFEFKFDLAAREKYHTDNTFEYDKIIIKTNGGEVASSFDLSNTKVEIELKKNHYYTAELIGKMNGEVKAIAISSPIYT